MATMIFHRFLKDRRGGISADVRARDHSGLRPRRRRGRLQPRQFGAAPRMQAADDATALMLSKVASDADRSAAAAQGHRLLQRAVQPPRGEEPRHHADLHHRRRLAARHHRHRRRSTPSFMKIMGFSTSTSAATSDGEMGQHAPARRARARQHRLDGRRRQDRRRSRPRPTTCSPSSRTPPPTTATSMCRSFRS